MFDEISDQLQRAQSSDVAHLREQIATLQARNEAQDRALAECRELIDRYADDKAILREQVLSPAASVTSIGSARHAPGCASALTWVQFRAWLDTAATFARCDRATIGTVIGVIDKLGAPCADKDTTKARQAIARAAVERFIKDVETDCSKPFGFTDYERIGKSFMTAVAALPAPPSEEIVEHSDLDGGETETGET